MKQVDVFYFDVDGTIYDNDTNTISDNTKNSIKQLQDLGYKVVMATGRTVGAIANTDIKDAANWDGYILANGGLTLDSDFEVVRNLVCEEDFINRLVENYPGTVILEGDEIYPMNEISDYMHEFFMRSEMDLHTFPTYAGEDIQKIIIEDINLIEGGLDNPIFDGYTYEINTHDMYEVFPEQSGKHIAIKEYNNEQGYSKYAYFGDGNNDAQAIKLAHFGVAMGNGVESAKAAADFVTEAVSEDGITHALKYFEII